MINIKDIQAQRLKNPEPNEVKRIRALITDYFKDLVFIEDSHQYFLGDRELRPVSSVCHSFEPYVDWDSIAENKAKKLGKTKEELQEEWHQKNIISTSCGSKTHYFGEQMMNLFIGRDVNLPFQYTRDGYMIPYCPKEKAIESYYTDILNNPNVYPIMPEAKIFLTDYEGTQLINPYAGTFDILLGYRMKDGSIKASVHDFKGLPLDTPILTISGFKKMGELEVGDYVYDKDGNPVKILNTSNIHNNPCLKITFDDGYSIVADHEHRWLVSIGKEEKVLTTNELSECIKPKIYINKPLNNNKGDIYLDTYIFDILFGDDNINQTKEMKDKILFSFIVSSTFEQRFSLLCKVMDISGYYNKTDNTYVLEIEKSLISFYTLLLASLGIKPILQGAKINFIADRYPFKSTKHIDQNYRIITKIEAVDTVPTRCIEVDSPSHTYLAGEMLLVTHNTNASLINDFNRSKSNRLLAPFQDFIDEPLSMYSIQLSLYQLGLESIGIEVVDRNLIWLKEDGTYEKIGTPDLTTRLLNTL